MRDKNGQRSADWARFRSLCVLATQCRDRGLRRNQSYIAGKSTLRNVVSLAIIALARPSHGASTAEMYHFFEGGPPPNCSLSASI